VNLQAKDPAIFDLIQQEERRQREGLELIPSENYASKAVLQAVGSIFMDKYSEGYPRKRYYGGNEVVDELEELCIQRARAVFETDYHVNVQPLSGSPANMAVYVGLLEFGDKVLGMNLAHGGHLTHGHKVNFSGRAFNFVQYGVRADDERIDYDALERIANDEQPKLIVSGATCYPRLIDFERISGIAHAVGAVHMADVSHIAGLIAGGAHPSPFPHTDVVTTTTHKTLRGPRGAVIFCQPQFAERIDKAIFPGLQGGPHDHVNAGKAVAFAEALTPEFKLYAKQVVANAQAMAGELMKLGHRLVSGGTENHLMLLDLRPLNLQGRAATTTLDRCGLTVNQNAIPFDPAKPFNPSGIRLGTPSVTSRGINDDDMRQIARWIDRALRNPEDDSVVAQIREETRAFARQFPLPGLDL